MRSLGPGRQRVKWLALAAFLLNLTSDALADELADNGSPALAARSESLIAARSPQKLLNRSDPTVAAEPAQRNAVHTSLAKLPLAFEQNHGQTDAQVKFLTRGPDYLLFLTADEAVFVLRGKGPESPATLRLKLGAGNPAPEIEALDRQSGYVNHFIGNDPERWRTKVPRFAKVRYKSVYPGIDLVYHGSQQQLEYDFVVAPGADPTAIQMSFSADASDLSLTVTEDGDLLVETGGKTLRQKKPIAYQEIDGKRRTVDAEYEIHRTEHGAQRVTLALSDYDRAQPLIIDPALIYSTYLGGPTDGFGQPFGRTDGRGVTVDANGFIYVTGSTNSTDFPGATSTPAAAVTHAFVAKLTPSGLGASDLVWATVFGGTVAPTAGFLAFDIAHAIAIDSTGKLSVSGETGSSDFPVTTGAYQTAIGTFFSNPSAFIARFDTNGALVYGSYFGGGAVTRSVAIAVDASNDILITGEMVGRNFPTTPGALRETTPGVRFFAAFVAKFRPGGQGVSDLLYSSLIDSAAIGFGIAADSRGRAYVVGRAGAGLPVSTGAFQPTAGGAGAGDGFLVVIDPVGNGASDLVYGTFFGGPSDDYASAVTVDALGTAYLTGTTGGGIPTTPGAFQTSGVDLSDAFVAAIQPGGQGADDLLYSSYLAGQGTDIATGIALDHAGLVWVTGYTTSDDFPVSGVHSPPAFSEDSFAIALNPIGSGVSDRVFGQFLGGTGNDEANGIAAGPRNVAIVGNTGAPDFPTTGGVLQGTRPGVLSAFVTAFSPGSSDQQTTTTLISSLNPAGLGVAIRFTATLTGNNPTGAVVFRDGVNRLGSAPLVGNSAQLTVSTLTAGDHSITAIYSGDANNRTSTSAPLIQRIGGSATAILLLSSANPSFVGQSVTFTAALTSASLQVPTGTVRFEDNGTPLATVNINAQGNAIFTTSALTLGNHQITAIYDGNATFLASSASLTQRVTQAVDLAISKNVSATVGTVGQSLTYTLQVSNNSANDGTGVVVRDTLPANVTVNSLPPGCTQAANLVTCALGNFAAKSNLTLTILITPTAPGIFTNTATIGGNEADPAPGNNFSSVTTTVDAADLAVTLTDAPDPIAVGGTLVYTIGVSNAGPSTATNVTLTFTIDPSLVFASFSSSGLQGAACAGQTIITCSFASLPSGTKGTITFGFTTTAVGTISATATIASPNPDPNTGNNSASATTFVARPADLAVSITDAPDPVTTNGAITYTITVTNSGPVTDAGVNVSGTLTGVAAIDVNSIGFIGGNFSACSALTASYSCQNGRLTPGESATITLRAFPNAVGIATLNASVSGGEADPNLANNAASASTTVQPFALAPIYTQGASYRIELPPQPLAPIYTQGASYRIEPPPLALAPIYTQGASYRIQEVDELAPIYTQGASYMIGNTPPGTNVTVQVGGVTITYSNVQVPGNTTVTPISLASVGPLPSGYAVIGNLAFEIATDAIVSGPITLTFTVPSVNDAQVFANLRVLHSENFKLIDRTILPPNAPAPNFASRSISARVGSLSPFVIALFGPRGIKQSVLDELAALRASVTDKQEGMKLDDAVRNLQQSLSSAYWIDEIRLAPRYGDQVFQAEKRAITSLQTLMKQRKSLLSQSVLRGFISRIIDADRLLAFVAIDDAVAAQRVPSEIKKAREELARADADIANNKNESGIEHYRQAWKLALKAVGQ